MTEDLEPKRTPSELAQQKGHMLARWLYGEIAAGREVSVEQVRAKMEGPEMSYDDCTDAYHIADKENEQQRALATQSRSEEEYEERNLYAQVQLHEDITFLLQNAETAMAQAEGII